jgi:catechol 2,3-dioxygenase-like lactoylglutathione lyase family enzyme
MVRREFLEKGISFASLLLMHKQAQSTAWSPKPDKVSEEGKSRFSNIELYTSKLEEQQSFYSDILNFPIIRSHSNSFTVKTGASRLTFNRSLDDSHPVYHYAVNIPTNKFIQGKEWLMAKTKLLIDSQHGRDELFFESWNAHAVYFKDPAGNIGELIARHTLNNKREGTFTVDDLLNISEIGIPADDPQHVGARLSSAFGLRQYLNSTMFIGDEQGLFVIPPIGRPWIPERIERATAFPVNIKISDKQLTKFNLTNHPYEVTGE